jgi:hypothetical protein
VPGTAGVLHPFFAPDGRDVAFFADGFLQRVGVDADATPFRICERPGVDRGGARSPNGTIAVAIVAQGLFKVAASGGSLEAIGEDLRAAGPSLLLNGTTVLYALPAAQVPRMLNRFDVIALDGSGQHTVAPQRRRGTG